MHWWERFSGGVAIPIAAIADTYAEDQSMGEATEISDTFELDAVDPGPEDQFPIIDAMTQFVFGAPARSPSMRATAMRPSRSR